MIYIKKREPTKGVQEELKEKAESPEWQNISERVVRKPLLSVSFH